MAGTRSSLSWRSISVLSVPFLKFLADSRGSPTPDFVPPTRPGASLRPAEAPPQVRRMVGEVLGHHTSRMLKKGSPEGRSPGACPELGEGAGVWGCPPDTTPPPSLWGVAVGGQGQFLKR